MFFFIPLWWTGEGLKVSNTRLFFSLSLPYGVKKSQGCSNHKENLISTPSSSTILLVLNIKYSCVMNLPTQTLYSNVKISTSYVVGRPTYAVPSGSI